MEFTVEQKSLLAKLMATENITVEHRKARTAMFDLKTRTLICPVWENMSGDLYDLLLGHEISHALHTPQQGWHNAVTDGGKSRKVTAFKHFINVTEDARIEKKIKNKYPGLRMPMISGYRSLLSRNFFSINKMTLKEINDLFLIDRLNLAAKLGESFGIRFSNEELPLYTEMMDAESWEQSLEVAKKIYDYSKKEQQQRENPLTLPLPDEMDSSDSQDDEEYEDGGGEYEDYQDSSDDEKGDGAGNTDEDGEEGDSSTSKSGEGDDKEESDEKDGKGSSKSSDKDKEKKKDEGEQKTSGTGAAQVDEEFVPEAMTDKIFRDKETDLLSKHDHLSPLYMKIPTPNMDGCFTPAERVNSLIEQYFMNTPQRRAVAYSLYQKFRKKNDDYINLLVKEFEMRKAAKSYSRRKLSETGDICVNRLVRYRIDEDIFRKMVRIQSGKSHGLILLLDKSGSMGQHYRGAMEQTIVLALFCKKVGIPFRAFTFTDGRYAGEKDFGKSIQPISQFTRKNKELHLPGFNLREIFTSEMSTARFTSSIMNHIALTEAMMGRFIINNVTVEIPPHEGLGGTPLIQSIVVMRDIMNAFKKKHRLDIAHMVIIHDGDANGIGDYYTEDFDPRRPEHIQRKMRINESYDRVVLVDEKQKIQVPLDMNHPGQRRMQWAFMKWFQLTTGCKIFGFYVTDARYVRTIIQEFGYEGRTYNKITPKEIDQLRDTFIEERFAECHTPGYTRFYVIPGSRNLETESGILEQTDKVWTPGKLLTAFKKANNTKRVSRILIGRLMEMIATH